MNEVKKPATYVEQITRLKKHGCVIVNENFCKNVLDDINLYHIAFPKNWAIQLKK